MSATGIEFAYSQAPASMKGVIMALWYLAVTIGNLWVLLANASVRNDAVIARIAETGLSETAFLMFFFAGFALVVALIFGSTRGAIRCRITIGRACSALKDSRAVARTTGLRQEGGRKKVSTIKDGLRQEGVRKKACAGRPSASQIDSASFCERRHC